MQRDAGITFVFVTHDQEEALAMGDRIAVFRSGQLEQLGTPTEMYEEPASAFVAGFLGETNVIEASADHHGVVRLGGNGLLIAPEKFWSGSVLVTIRPERVVVVQPSAPDHHLVGKIRTVYLGNEIRYDVDVVRHKPIQVRQPLTSPGIRAVVGDDVGLRFDETMVRYLPVEGD